MLKVYFWRQEAVCWAALGTWGRWEKLVFISRSGWWKGHGNHGFWLCAAVFFLSLRKVRLSLKWIGCSSSFISWSTPDCLAAWTGEIPALQMYLGRENLYRSLVSLELCCEVQLWGIFRHGAGGKRETHCGSCCLSMEFLCLVPFPVKESLLWNSQEIGDMIQSYSGPFSPLLIVHFVVWSYSLPPLSCEQRQAKPNPVLQDFFVYLQKHAKGQDLLKKVCDHLNLLEEDYFGLAIWDTPTSRVSSCWPWGDSALPASSPQGRKWGINSSSNSFCVLPKYGLRVITQE